MVTPVADMRSFAEAVPASYSDTDQDRSARDGAMVRDNSVVDITKITPETQRAAGLKKWTLYPDTLGMWVAESDFGVASVIQSAIQEAVDRQAYGYLDPALAKETTDACAAWYANQYGFAIDQDLIRLVGDVLSALDVAITHFVPNGAPVVIATPAYMPFIPLSKALGHPVIEVPLIQGDGEWAMDIDAISAALVPGSLFILCNPHNPTGRVYRRDELEELSVVVDAAGARVFSDEIHAPLVYGEAHHTPYASVSETTALHTITATSASKAWNMPGLKCAQLIFTNPADAQAFDRSGAWESFSTGILGVVANKAAYRDGQPWLTEFTELMDSNMAALDTQLAQLLPEARFARPQGTFLAWLDVRAYDPPEHIDAYLREHAQVSVTDGRSCGRGNEGFIRLCMATTPAIAEEAVTRIAAALTHRP